MPDTPPPSIGRRTTFADPVRAQSALDRFTSRAFDLVIEGESYRTRLKRSLPAPARKGPAAHG